MYILLGTDPSTVGGIDHAWRGGGWPGGFLALRSEGGSHLAASTLALGGGTNCNEVIRGQRGLSGKVADDRTISLRPWFVVGALGGTPTVGVVFVTGRAGELDDLIGDIVGVQDLVDVGAHNGGD